EARLQADADVQVGDQVVIVGFAEHGTTKPILVDGFAIRTGVGPLPLPRVTSAHRVLQRNDDANLVEIGGILTEAAWSSQAITLTVDADGTVFDAVYRRHLGDRVPDLPVAGSRIAVIG